MQESKRLFSESNRHCSEFYISFDDLKSILRVFIEIDVEIKAIMSKYSKKHENQN